MKKLLLILFISILHLPLFAAHITGGEVIYDYLGPGAGGNSSRYSVTLRLFRDNLCVGCAVMPTSVSMGIFDNDNNTQFGNYINVNLTSTFPLSVIAAPPCLTNTPNFDYSGGIYTFEVQLPINTNGYTIAYQTCCRVGSITNIGNATNVGSTYIGEIPGTNTLPVGNDNSARFRTGISIICQNKNFILDFSATDPDPNDVLVYSLVGAYGGGQAVDASFATPSAPPYGLVPYSTGYNGLQPLGPNATINVNTGIISGIAPAAGKYIVSVLVKSFRNGVFIADHRKDFIVTVAPCDFASAELKPVYNSCDGFTFTVQNLNSSALNLTYDWDFGDPASGANNTSNLEFPDPHTYTSAGDFVLTLIVNKNTPCADTATAIVRVYPGFFPAFGPLPPQCKNTPVQFTDATTATFGAANFWRWDFGVTNLTNDTSRLQNPTYTYTTPGTYNAQFIVETDKGCRDTLYPVVTIVDKPEFFISRDTLICRVDTLQLTTNVNSGNITWSPNIAINNVNSFNPLVSPDVTTTYTANYTDQFGCSTSASVKINVVTDVSLLAINDTTICRTDTTRLNLNTDALYFTWTPSNVIQNPTVQNPIIFPTAPSTTFHVVASISNKCFVEKDIVVKTVPYPVANITGDSPICFGKSSQLNASGGSIYLWSPPAFLNNVNIANPIAQTPTRSVLYSVTVRDTLGCPKPVTATFNLDVIRVIANAGPQDTSVVLDEPLQLQATGGTIYTWSPSTYLNNVNISNPISLPQNNITYTVNVSNNIGCSATDTINVRVFFLPPDLYVPKAFTPSKDGLNDIFRPIALGIRNLEYFRIYNRWGELVYVTSKIGEGWDGRYKGVPQETGTFVWQASAVDFKGRKIVRKGNVILIR